MLIQGLFRAGRGLEVRNASTIYLLELQYEKVKVYVPADILGVKSSFLEEFIVNLLVTRGDQKVSGKSSVHSNGGKYRIDDDLEETLDRIKNSESSCGISL